MKIIGNDTKIKVNKLLEEDLASAKNYYPSISQEDFDRVIELDPTFDRSKDKLGNYGKWLLGLFSRKALTDENRIKDVLKSFDTNKNNLKVKDIMSFKTVDDLDAYLNDEDNYKELSKRQQLRQTQKAVRNTNLVDDADLVYEDSDWLVYVPKTYEASCKLGRGTSWCTATTESDNYYKQYTGEGKLYININKHNPSEKYQFHFESDSFMDKDDEEVELIKFFSDNRELLDFYDKKVKEAKSGISEAKSALRFITSDGKFIYNGKTHIHNNIRPIIKSIEILPDVKSIEDGAFQYCTNLTSVTIPDSVTHISYGAFCGCRSLTSITIPDSVTSIGSYAFYKCKDLTNITIPDSVESIGREAFYWCINLKSIVIPDSVTSIGSGAFWDCINLKNIYYTGSEEQFKDINWLSVSALLDNNPTIHYNSKLKEESLEESFEIHKELNPNLFENNKLKSEVREKLIEIADEFINKVKEDEIPIKVYDYWLVGSNASFNYNDKSDIDLHIIVDIDNTENPKLIEIIYNLLKSKFNDRYDISIKGQEVELYLEDINSTVMSNGIYSIKKDEWVKEPKQIDIEPIDVEDTDEYDKLFIEYENLEDSDVESFIDNLYILRKESLSKDGEYGLGNLIFKEFRNNGYIDNLKDRLVEIRSKELTLEGLNN